MYSSGNIDVQNLVHLFESRCILELPQLKHSECSRPSAENIHYWHIQVRILKIQHTARIVVSDCSFCFIQM